MHSTSSPILSGKTSASFAHHPRAQAQHFAGDGCKSASEQSDKPLSDEAREEAIRRAGKAVEKHMATWWAEGCFAARGDADRAMRLMVLLIAGRSPQQVQKMERERGLR